MSELDLSKDSVDINASELGMDTDEAGKALGEQGGQKIADEAMNNPQAGHEGIKGGWIDPATVDLSLMMMIITLGVNMNVISAIADGGPRSRVCAR